METLVIYFSQKGKTKEAAGRIAQLSGADLAEIKTHKSTGCLIEKRYLPH